MHVCLHCITLLKILLCKHNLNREITLAKQVNLPQQQNRTIKLHSYTYQLATVPVYKSSRERECGVSAGSGGTTLSLREAIHHRRLAKCILIHCPTPAASWNVKNDPTAHTHSLLNAWVCANWEVIACLSHYFLFGLFNFTMFVLTV